jgi:hypothetical protein
MLHRSGRRLLTGLAAAAASFTLATPALAADATVTMKIDDVQVAVGGTATVYPVLYADRETELPGASVTYVLSGDAAGVTLYAGEESSDCERRSSTKLVCSLPYPIDLGPDGVIGYLPAGVRAATSAKAGSVATVTATFAADGVQPVTATSKVTVADGVDLVAPQREQTIKVKPGAGFDAALQVRNASSVVVHGAVLTFWTDYGFEGTEQFSNCRYEFGQPRQCVFDQDLDAGATYRLTVPYRLRKDTYAPSNLGGEFNWATKGDSPAAAARLGAAGSGSALRLTPVAALRAAGQTDTNPDNNTQVITIAAQGKQGADFVALGAKVSGAAGAVVDAPVGLRNAGPATVDFSRSGSSPGLVIVTPPAGTKVVTIPAGCELAEDGSYQTKPGTTQYACVSGPRVTSGQTLTWKFGLKIEKVTPNATGSVEVNPKCACDRFAKDLNPANNVAAIVANPAGGTGNGGNGDGSGGSGGSDGGGLPITGPAGAAIGGAGVLLVGAGVIGFVLARRRRTRFQA